MLILKLILLALGITFSVFGYLIVFKKKFGLINDFEARKKVGSRTDADGMRVGKVAGMEKRKRRKQRQRQLQKQLQLQLHQQQLLQQQLQELHLHQKKSHLEILNVSDVKMWAISMFLKIG